VAEQAAPSDGQERAAPERRAFGLRGQMTKSQSMDHVREEIIAISGSGVITLLAIVLAFIVAFPPQNWLVILVFGGGVTLARALIARTATQAAVRRGLDIEAQPGAWPNRWTLLRTLGWLLAFASMVATIGSMCARPRSVRRHLPAAESHVGDLGKTHNE
jgi:hypothetical protein